MALRSIVFAFSIIVGSLLISSCVSHYNQTYLETTRGKTRVLKQEPLDSLGNQCLVTGRVFNVSGQYYAPSAHVILGDINVSTDFDGYFELLTSPGTYDITVKSFGTKDLTLERIKLRPGSKTEVLFYPGYTSIVCY